MLPDVERREYIKPIMFSGGIGQLEGSHITKELPKKGLLTYHKENNYFIFIML